jgi:hypothetical protein
MHPRLIIDLDTLPDEGRQVAGELPPEVFDLPPGDARPVGPLCYDLYAQRFEGELFLSGSLSAPFEFTCVRTVHPFVRTIRIEQVPISLEIGRQSEIDVTDALREEVLLQFPANPRCDEADEPMRVFDRPPVFGGGQAGRGWCRGRACPAGRSSLGRA